MAKPKRPEYKTYAEAMNRVEQLSVNGDRDSVEYRIAINAAARLFINENDKPKQFTQQHRMRRKMLTINELIKMMCGNQEI